MDYRNFVLRGLGYTSLHLLYRAIVGLFDRGGAVLPYRDHSWLGYLGRHLVMTPGAIFALHAIPAALLLAAIMPLPYGYYIALRLVVCIAAAWLAVLDYQRTATVTPWVIGLGVVAILFNPVVPVHLTREIWFFLNIATAALLGVHFLTTRNSSSE